MRVISKIVEVPNNGNPSVDYIENCLEKLHISPLRWAVVDISDKMYKISVANLED